MMMERDSSSKFFMGRESSLTKEINNPAGYQSLL
jgi:hypothetical protein